VGFLAGQWPDLSLFFFLLFFFNSPEKSPEVGNGRRRLGNGLYLVA
jgi:hypothetical protein